MGPFDSCSSECIQAIIAVGFISHQKLFSKIARQWGDFMEVVVMNYYLSIRVILRKFICLLGSFKLKTCF